jgi:photosystem II stability/assembly factor-like uncharacterized protein
MTGVSAGIKGTILTTTNSGANWLTKNINNSSLLKDAFLKNGNEIFAVSEEGQIFKTSDFGENWVTNFTLGANFNKIEFLNENTGFVLGNNGRLLKTTDNGNSWIVLNVQSYSYMDIYVKDSASIFVVTTSGTILKSTNYGNLWIEIASGFGSLKSITFMDEYGYACGDYGFIIRTTNSGLNWQNVFDDENIYNLNSIDFVNCSTGYAVGIDYAAHGIILKTTNNGLNWVSLFSGTSNTLTSVVFTSENTGYVVGSSGTIIKTTTGGGEPISIQPLSNTIPEKFMLYQNYPNPFNPVTTIRFSIPTAQNKVYAKLVIYDILGREVKLLLNQFLVPGEYSIEFDASDLPSGVYFYQLQSSSFSMARKMILLK